jgi:hypothetical protein
VIPINSDMRIREITIQNLRLLKDVHIPFERDGSPRLWTVFIGRNGTGKTSILQAIALAAAGNAGALSLAGDKVREQLPDLRTKQEAVIRAKFEFGELGQKYGEKPLLGATSSPTGVRVQLRVPPGRDPLRSVSWYTTSEGEGVAPEAPATEETDPLVKARTASLNHWFVAGYGMQRNVEDRKPGSVRPSWPSIDRLRPLFEPTSLVGPNFMDILPDDSLKREFAKTLKQIITGRRHDWARLVGAQSNPGDYWRGHVEAPGDLARAWASIDVRLDRRPRGPNPP